MPITRVRSHVRRTRHGIVIVRTHVRNYRSRQTNGFYQTKNFSNWRRPYWEGGLKLGPIRTGLRIDREGIKAKGSAEFPNGTEVEAQKNLITNVRKLSVKHGDNEADMYLP
jgi:hypothetical protein